MATDAVVTKRARASAVYRGWIWLNIDLDSSYILERVFYDEHYLPFIFQS